MNREIEFRGKNKDGEWIYGYYYKETSTSLALQEYGIGEINTHYILTVINHLPFKVEVIGESVGQYTGVKDKNGKKIFEGDVYHHGDPDITYTVVWSDTSFRGKQNNSSSYAGLEAWKDRIEVIGNVYEDNLESEVN